MSRHPATVSFILLACATLALSLKDTSAFADEPWVGRRIVITKRTEVPLRVWDDRNKQKTVGKVTDEVLTVEKAGEGWLFVRSRGVAGWIKQDEAALLANAPQHFTDIIDRNPNDPWGYVKRGVSWLESGKYELALKDLEQSTRLDANLSPSMAVRLGIRGTIWARKKDYDKALVDFNEALRLDAKSDWAYFQRANLWHAKKDFTKAIADFGEVLRLDPNYPWAHSNRGAVWHAMGQFDKAIADFDEEIRLNSGQANVYVNRAISRFAKKEYDKGFADCSEALRLDPKNALAYNTRGRGYDLKRDFDKAIADYNEAIRLEPKSPDGYTNRGMAWHAKREYDKAAADYSEAIRLDPDSPNGYAGRADIWFAKKDYDRAIDDFNMVIKLVPKLTVAYYTRGRCWYFKKEMDKAIADFSEVIRVTPDDSKALSYRADAWSTKKDYDRAIADYSELLRLNPKNAYARTSRGTAFMNKKDYDRALADFDEVIRLNAENPGGYHGRGQVWSARRDYAKALAEYDEATRVDPSYEPSFNARAWIWATSPDAARRDGKKAVESATKACQLTAWKNADYLDTLAAAYAEAGDFTAAVKWAKQALELSGLSKEGADEVRQRLKLYEEGKAYRQPARTPAERPVGWLGVNTTAVSARLAPAKDWPTSGALIEFVVPESPAEKAGLREGDVLLKINDVVVANTFQFSADMKRFKSGDRLALEIFRQGQRPHLTAVLGEIPSDAESVKSFLKGVDKGNKRAINQMGSACETGKGAAKDYAEALKWYRRAADLGHAAGQNNLGRMYQNGFGVAKDQAEAAKWYRLAAEQDDPWAQDNLGWMYARGVGVPKDYAESLKWHRLSADLGNPNALNNLGVIYANGWGVDKDEQEAIKCYRKAADLGNAWAQTNLAWRYASGAGVAKDDVEALRLYRLAAEQNNPSGQYNLGSIFEYGRAVPKDMPEALKWYRKAAEQGYTPATNKMAYMYKVGIGVPKDLAETAKWYQKGADGGDGLAQFNLAQIYENGQGVARDLKLALAWYRKAADNGQQAAKRMMTSLERRLSLGDPPQAKDIYKLTLRGTAFVINGEISGTGWLLDRDKKLLVTNFHVVVKKGKTNVVVDEVKVVFPVYQQGKAIYERSYYKNNLDKLAIRAKVLANDPWRDLAVLELDRVPDEVEVVPLAMQSPEPGDTVHSVGNPGASQALWVYSSGTVRTVHHKNFRTTVGEHNIRVIETQTPINPGDSGGPVVNDRAELVGVVQSRFMAASLFSACVDLAEVNFFINNFQRARDPKTAADYVTRANDYYYRDDGLDQAIRDCTKAIELDPRYVVAYSNRGLAYVEKKEYRSAFADFDKAIDVSRTWSPEFTKMGANASILAKCYHGRGRAHWEFGENDKAMSDFNQAIELDPRFVRPYLDRGSLRFERGDSRGATADWEQVLRIAGPNEPDIIAKAKYNIEMAKKRTR